MAQSSKNKATATIAQTANAEEVTTTTSSTPSTATKVTQALTALQAVEVELTNRILEREAVISGSLIALLSRQHIVLLGPPGTAKSDLVRQLADRIVSPVATTTTDDDTEGNAINSGISGSAGLKYFVWLMTRFTTPDEIFGPISVQGLKNDDYRRITAHKLTEADIASLDEIFKSNSAILNALLTILNERVFDNGSQRINVPLITLFGASNELPQGEDLEALWDRFGLRYQVGYVSDSGFSALLKAAVSRRLAKINQQIPPARLSRGDLTLLQSEAQSLPIPAGILAALEQLRRHLANKGIIVSDRRWVQSLDLIQANALLEGRNATEEDDLVILSESLWSNPEQRKEIASQVSKLANPLNGKAIELGDQATSVYNTLMQNQKSSSVSDTDKMKEAIEVNAKLKKIAKQLTNLKNQAKEQTRSTAKIDKQYGDVRRMSQEVAALIVVGDDED